MKKLIAGVLAGLLCLAGAGKVFAQNFPSTVISYAVGAPGFVLNGGGSTNWGQLTNVNSTTWGLGYGAASSAAGTFPVAFNANGTMVLNYNTSGQVNINPSTSLAIDSKSLLQVNSLINASSNAYYYVAFTSNGWLALHNQTNVLPTISSCGSSPSLASGTDEAGDVTVGTSPSNTCTVTFASTLPQIPHCTCNDNSLTQSPCQVSSLSTSGFTMSAAKVAAFAQGTDALAANDRLDWVCLSHQ